MVENYKKTLLCMRSNSNCHKTIKNQHGLIFKLLLTEIENSVTAWRCDGQVLFAVYCLGKTSQTLMGLDILKFYLDTCSKTKETPDVLQLWVWEGIGYGVTAWRTFWVCSLKRSQNLNRLTHSVHFSHQYSDLVSLKDEYKMESVNKTIWSKWIFKFAQKNFMVKWDIRKF